MFSIIIPVGPGRDARRALGSLADSGLSDSDEVIVVADGHELSLDAYQLPFPVQFESSETAQGANEARNRGASYAAHPLLCFLDDDDAHLPGALTRLRQIISASPDAQAWSLDWCFDSGRAPAHARKRLPAIFRESAIRRRNLAGGCSSMVLRKALFDQVGGFDASLPAMQDWDLWLRIARTTDIHRVPDAMIAYDDRTTQRISTNTSARIRGLAHLLAKHQSFWNAFVCAFHRARIEAARYQAGEGRLTAIFQWRAPLASIGFAIQALCAGRRRS